MQASPDVINKKIYMLQAGVFSIRYENGFLRHISYGNIEVVRMIYMALRDQNWTTFEPIIENEEIDLKKDSFKIQYDCFHELNGKRIFHWLVTLTGSADSKITFEIQGEALADLLKNRAGICVLHPVKSTAGHPCEMLHTNGDQIKTTFPVLISAANPFKNLRGFRWRCHYDWFVLQFDGEAFETEDQRNWSDASYKTFCTPLEKPFPVKLKAGDKIHQRVIFQPESELLPVPSSQAQDKAFEIVALEKKSVLPGIGIAASTETDTLSEENIQALKDLNLSHYRIEVVPSTALWADKFKMDCDRAEALNLPLKIGLHIATPGELQEFCQIYSMHKPNTKWIILLSLHHPATQQLIIDNLESLRRLIPNVEIGAGTDYNFRELNCNLFDAEFVDFISYSIDPQEHAIDDQTVIENIAAQADTVISAKSLYGESKPVHISSLTLKKRFNPAATIPQDKILPNDRKRDPRQETSFCAVFTLGSIKSLAFGGVRSVTFYQTIGTQGLLSESGKKYPVYEVLKEVLTAGKPYVVHTESSKPLLCDALLLNKDQSFKLILANYSSEEQRVVFRKDEYTLTPYEIRVVNIS